MPKNGKVKIEDLARMVKTGFDRVDQKFDEMKEGINKRFDDVDERLKRIEFTVSGHDRRLDIMEDKMRQLAVKVGLRFN